MSDEEKSKIVEKYNLAVDNYNKYLAKNPNAEDKDKITTQIDYINSQISKYNTERNTDLSSASSSPSSEEE